MKRTFLWLGAVLGVLIGLQLLGLFYTAYTARTAADTARATAIAQKRESRERVDQTCTLFETNHLADVRQLRETYRYLGVVQRRGELGQTINRFVLAGLPALETKAHTDTAPSFCDEPGLGLPEPDPVVPKRPSSLKP